MIRGLDDSRYIIDIDDRPATVSTSLLLAGYVAADTLSQQQKENVKPPRLIHFDLQDPNVRDVQPDDTVLRLSLDQATSRGRMTVATLPNRTQFSTDVQRTSRCACKQILRCYLLA